MLPSRLPRWIVAALALALPLDAGAAAGAPVTAAQAVEVPAPAPVMGWASWNTFAAKINHTVIEQQAAALVSSGLAAAGYRYVNIDEGWWQGTRDAAGNMTVDTNDWPGGMSAIADHLHQLGLKAGIYTDAGRDGCGYYFPTGRPAAPGSGSENHYEQDFLQFARWGFDFVKVDWCGGDAEGLDAPTQYRQIRAAVDRATALTGHRLLLSVCNWGKQDPATWGPGVGEMWRTNTDIIFFGENASMARVLTALDRNQHPTAQHTGFVNDPDMMVVGMPAFTAAQNRTHLSLWAISGAPLLAGNNLATMTAETAAILGNRDVIAIDQDPRGLPAVKVAEDRAGQQVYAKVLSGAGRRAVALLNRTAAAAPMTVRWASLGLDAGPAAVRNVWSGADAGSPATGYTVTVPAGEAVLLTVTGTEAPAITYEAEDAVNTRGGAATVVACPDCSGGARVTSLGSGAANTLRFGGIASANGAPAVADIVYTNGDAVTRTAILAADGVPSTVVAFPPTGSWSTPGTVSVVLTPTKGATNALTWSNPTAPAPDIDAVIVRALG